jgi:hypothetical protein
VLCEIGHLGLTLLHLLLLGCLPRHNVLDLVHRIVDVQGDTDGKRHLVGVVNAHAEEALHGLEFLLILRGDWATSTLVDELDDTVRYILPLTVDWSDQEVLDLGGGALVVDLILELGLFGRIVRDEDLPRIECLPRDTAVAWELHELLVVHVLLLVNLYLGVNHPSLCWAIGSWRARVRGTCLVRLHVFLVVVTVLILVVLPVLQLVRVSEQPVALEVVYEDTYTFESEEFGEVLLHLPEEPLMVPLCADLAGQPQGVHHCLLA